MWDLWKTVRRFGLGHCDLRSQIWNVAVFLRLLAVNIRQGSKPILKILYIWNAGCIACYIFNYQISVWCFVFIFCRQTGAMLDGVLVMSVSLNSLIGVTKLICMYIDHNKIQSIVTSYMAYDRLPWPSSTAGVHAATMRVVKKRAVLFWATMMGNAILYNLQPVLMPARHVLYDGHVRYGAELILGITNNVIVTTSIVICILFTCYTVANITGLLIVTTGYSEARMLALGKELRELWSDALQHYSKNFDSEVTDSILDKNATKEMNKYIKHRLDVIVQYHAINIELVKKVETIFRGVIAIEFVLLSAGLVADLLADLVQTSMILPFSLMQVSMDCYIGQKLMDASRVFEDSVYDCKWENFDVQNRKTVLLILQMSQKPLSLSAGGVATLDFGCLMAMYKAIYSAYAALRSTMH